MAKRKRKKLQVYSLSLLLVVSGKHLLHGKGVGRLIGNALLNSHMMGAALLSAGVFYTSKNYAKGHLSTEGDTCPEPAKDVDVETSSVSIKNSQGTPNIYIQNLSINITAPVVEQLNMNPQEVINQFTDQIGSLVNTCVCSQGALKRKNNKRSASPLSQRVCTPD